MKLADFQAAYPEKEQRPNLAHLPRQVMNAADIKLDSFAAIPDWVNRSDKFGAAEKCCFAVIYAEIRKTGRRSCVIPQYVLARKLGVDERTVRRHVAALRDGGLLSVTDNRSRGRANEYFILHNDLRSKAEIQVENGCPEGGVAGTEQLSSTGQPRPVVTQDLRTTASSSEKKERRTKKNKLSFGELAEGSLCSPPFPQASKETAAGAQAVKNSSAADAPRQPTCMEEADMGFDDPEDDNSFAARKARFNATVKRAEADVSGDLTRKRQRASERIERKGAAGKWGEGILTLETKWRGLVAARLGVDPIGWGKKERSMTGDLLKRAAYDDLSQAFEFALTNWDRLFPHLVGPKRTMEEPSVQFFHNFADRILLISKLWAKHESTWKKIAEWRAEASKFDIMPNDLVKLLAQANADLAKTGFKI